jgi:hypothetical protein
MALWEQIKQKHENRKQNVASSNTDPNLLYNLLTQDKVKTQQQGSEGNLGDGLTNIAKAAKTFMGSGSTGSSSVPSMYQFGNLGSSASSGSVPSQYQFGNAGGSLFGGYNLGGSNAGAGTLGSSSAASSAASGATKSGGLFGGSGGGSSVPWAAIAKIAKEGYNGISGHDDKEYSDTEESIIYPLQGAAMGSMFGPWGALGGALYGLGYSFKDDLGMKDSNFITQITHPIGMGDGGGLRIGGKPILDLG